MEVAQPLASASARTAQSFMLPRCARRATRGIRSSLWRNGRAVRIEPGALRDRRDVDGFEVLRLQHLHFGEGGVLPCRTRLALDVDRRAVVGEVHAVLL